MHSGETKKQFLHQVKVFLLTGQRFSSVMLVVANIASSRDEEATRGLVAHFFLIPSRLFSFSVLLSPVTTDA